MTKKKQHYSGIGGQAVLEGVMMRNKNTLAVAVRKPDHEIEVELEEYHGILENTIWRKIPVIRGVLAFIDSMAVGMKSMNFASSFIDEEDEGTARTQREQDSDSRKETAMTAAVTVISLVLAVGLFMVLPYFLSALLAGWIRNTSLMAILEGLIRLAIFLLYIVAISLMKDIRRLYMYHGAEHKCINCIEHGYPLTPEYVRKSSRFHKRCGSSFLVLVIVISVVLFFFIRVGNPAMRLVIRLLLVPLIAGISFEIIQFAGRSDSIPAKILSAPGILLQHLTTKEPTKGMILVGIAATEAAFDWKKYLVEEFGRSMDELDRITEEAYS